jgi:hypothetical protein
MLSEDEAAGGEDVGELEEVPPRLVSEWVAAEKVERQTIRRAKRRRT